MTETEDLRELLPGEQNILLLAAGASRTTYEILACAFMALEARGEATEESNTPEVRVDFRRREALWWSRAYQRLVLLEGDAPALFSRLEGLAYSIDQMDTPPPEPAPPAAPVDPDPWDGVPPPPGPEAA